MRCCSRLRWWVQPFPVRRRQLVLNQSVQPRMYWDQPPATAPRRPRAAQSAAAADQRVVRADIGVITVTVEDTVDEQGLRRTTVRARRQLHNDSQCRIERPRVTPASPTSRSECYHTVITSSSSAAAAGTQYSLNSETSLNTATAKAFGFWNGKKRPSSQPLCKLPFVSFSPFLPSLCSIFFPSLRNRPPKAS